ncbi:MAG: class I SAM-dependent methyltransferase [Campylobacterota bacterium]|nr:class I SAM-dependent methyltransferase [Campylobacterota bacterium]
MQPLDLYSCIEEYLDFEDEIHHLYKTIGDLILSKEIKTLIDIGCGQGEFCNIMNFNGVDTFGVDLSSKQIEIALKKNVKAQCIDIKDIKEKYNCATATFDVLNYISKKNITEFISNTYNLLEDDGYFIFDINTLYGFEEVSQGALTIDTQNKFISIDANYQDNVLYTDITLFEKQNDLYKKNSGTIEQFYHSKEDITLILESIGFNIDEIIEFNLHSTNQSDKQIFICKKGLK